MSHWLHLVPALLMWSLPSPSVAQTANYTTLTMFFTVNTTVHSTPRASSSSSANESTTSNQTEASPTNATSPLDDFSAGDSQMPPGSEGALTTLPAGQTETSATGKESTLRSAGPTSKPRPTPHGTEEGLPSTTPSRTLGGSSPTRAETSAGTTWETRRLSCEPSSVSVLSLDVTVEPPDRFYGSLTPDPGREGQGHHVMSQKALNQPKEEMKKPASPPQTHDEIQLKPMSESSVKIFL
ncbi:sialidase-like isoform X2 [Stegostoma tigrinum]|uniref:sialidase-like isoform X2 n=1 Tax=Stegostoma tigrinum TaxID=3053191 RepID=UPI00202B55C8|nr:sialidase-like isoform X2 [Stegostoma tigrinum]